MVILAIFERFSITAKSLYLDGFIKYCVILLIIVYISPVILG